MTNRGGARPNPLRQVFHGVTALAATGDEEDDRAFRDHVGGCAAGVGDVFAYEDGVVAVRRGSGERPPRRTHAGDPGRSGRRRPRFGRSGQSRHPQYSIPDKPARGAPALRWHQSNRSHPETERAGTQ
ncbi:hypothetical protein SAMN05428939_2191 [Streptomyces sp. TLI_105]|nr:hypothetical protein SAMN05428939_2191 [Streptomyces sp. TLI_105]